MAELAHSAKGTSWKNHKYIKKIGDRYIYAKDQLTGKANKFSSETVSNGTRVIAVDQKKRAAVRAAAKQAAESRKKLISYNRRGHASKAYTSRQHEEAVKRVREVQKKRAAVRAATKQAAESRHKRTVYQAKQNQERAKAHDKIVGRVKRNQEHAKIVDRVKRNQEHAKIVDRVKRNQERAKREDMLRDTAKRRKKLMSYNAAAAKSKEATLRKYKQRKKAKARAAKKM